MTDPERITVSREALRAELGGLELRLVDRITTEMAKKADVIELAEVRTELRDLHRDKADVKEVLSIRKKVDSVNTRLVVFSLTVAASALAVAFTVVLTALRKG